jgi:putative molybdopterin biosynthesis protein
MQKVQPLRSFERIKLLSDPRRLAILQLLMAKPDCLTGLARELKQSPAWVRHHLKTLEAAGLIEFAFVRTIGTVTEKFYQAKAGAWLLQELILPKSKKSVVIFSGSHDLALEAAAAALAKHINLLTLSVGSLDGLVNLRQGLCQISGAHLLDENGEYNIPFIHRLFPDREMEVVTLAYRTQGLIFTSGNPRHIRRFSDLTQPGVRFINRNTGSGTRLWIDKELNRLGISPKQILGYQNVVKTHSEAAFSIENGKADACIGLQAAARQHGLEFLPLFEERYDLVLERRSERGLTPLLDYIQTVEFRHATDSLTGYTTAHSGEQIPL